MKRKQLSPAPNSDMAIKKAELKADAVNAFQKAGRSLERWEKEIVLFHASRLRNEVKSSESRPGDSEAFNDGWDAAEDRCCPKQAIETAVSYLESLEQHSHATHVRQELSKILQNLVFLDYDIDGDYWPNMKKEIIDPLARYLDWLIASHSDSETDLFYPSRFFTTNTDITSEQLRQAAFEEKIRTQPINPQKQNSQKLYALNDVMKLWPEAFDRR